MQSDEQEKADQPPGTLIRADHGSRTTWHHSVAFDGYEHVTACGMTIDTDAIEEVIMDLQKWPELDDEDLGHCDVCAGSVGPFIKTDGLYSKYEVYEDGDRVEDCFVLEPNDDPAARAALIEYAEQTRNEELAQDLRDWVVDICTRGEPGVE